MKTSILYENTLKNLQFLGVLYSLFLPTHSFVFFFELILAVIIIQYILWYLAWCWNLLSMLWMLAFILSSLRGKLVVELRKRKEKMPCAYMVSWVSFTSFYKVYHIPIYKSKETVNLIKYNSQLISVEHRRSIPHQKRLLKYSQLPAAQKPFYMDKKHVTFNLSDAFYCHTFLSFNVLKSYKNNFSLHCSHV